MGTNLNLKMGIYVPPGYTDMTKDSIILMKYTKNNIFGKVNYIISYKLPDGTCVDKKVKYKYSKQYYIGKSLPLITTFFSTTFASNSLMI